MFTSNPFADLTAFLSPLFMQVYIILMIVAVAIGTLLDVYHKGSAEFFLRRREKAATRAKRHLSGTERASIIGRTIAEAAVSGEFGRGKRQASHLLTMYGFFLYVITTAIMAFAYATAPDTPAVLPILWIIGALMILVGGLWFFFFLRVNVAYDGDVTYHLGRADLFIGSLIGSALFALIWYVVETVSNTSTVVLIFLALYLFFTTLLFVSVYWSKFAHMFYKPAVAFQRKVEEADGASNLPSAAYGRHQTRR